MKNTLYNILTIFLISIMGVISALSLNSFSASGDDSLSIGDETEIISETPTTVDNSYTLGADASAYQRLDYAIDLYYNGDGFTSVYTQVCSVLGNNQYLYFKRYSGNGYNLTEEWYSMEGIFSAAGENAFKSYYCDGNIVNERVQKNNYDFAQKTYSVDKNASLNTYSVSKWVNEMKQLPINGLFTTLNSDTTTVITYDNKARGKDYYTIKLSIDANKLDENYLEIFRKRSDSFDIKSMIVTFKINKANGYIISYEREDLFSGTTMGFTGSVQMRTKECFTSMNVSAYSTIKTKALQNFNLSI